jgi:hypothetical protein
MNYFVCVIKVRSGALNLFSVINMLRMWSAVNVTLAKKISCVYKSRDRVRVNFATKFFFISSIFLLKILVF